MIGFVVGTACLVGLVKVLRGTRGCGSHHHRFHRSVHGYGGCGWGSCDGARFDRRGFGWDDEQAGARGGPSILLRALFERLQTTPGQERVIRSAFEELKEAAKKIAEERRATMKDLSDAVRGPTLDDDSMGAAFARLDAAVETLRSATFSALARVHEALDDEQRKRLAELIARAGGPGRFAEGLF